MFCSNCGNKIVDTAKFCPICGATTDVIISAPAASGQQIPSPQPTQQAPAPQPTYQQPMQIPGQSGSFAGQAQGAAWQKTNELDGPLVMVGGILLAIAALFDIYFAIRYRNIWSVPSFFALIAAAAFCFIKPSWGSKAIAGANAVSLGFSILFALVSLIQMLPYISSPFQYAVSLFTSRLLPIAFTVMLLLAAFDVLQSRIAAPIAMAVIAALSLLRLIVGNRFLLDTGDASYMIMLVLSDLFLFAGYTLVCFAFQQNRSAAGKPTGLHL